MKKKIIFIKLFSKGESFIKPFQESYDLKEQRQYVVRKDEEKTLSSEGRPLPGEEYYFCAMIVDSNEKKDLKCMLGKCEILRENNYSGFDLLIRTEYMTDDFSVGSDARRLKTIREFQDENDVDCYKFVKIKDSDEAFERIERVLSGTAETGETADEAKQCVSAQTAKNNTGSIPSDSEETEKKVIYIKLFETNDAKTYIESFEQSDRNTEKEYDKMPDYAMDVLKEGNEYYFCALVYNKENDRITKAMLGVGAVGAPDTSEQTAQNNFRTLRFNTLYKTDEIKYDKNGDIKYDMAVANLIKLTALDVNKDFDKRSAPFVMIEESEYAFNQIELMLTAPSVISQDAEYRSYTLTDQDAPLHPLAQRNEYCRRLHNENSKDNDEFQKDYGRIIHCKAFRRMVDKAQVFSASKGNYYRTRMTHSQAVAQIAGEIAARLKLNLKLTEAIALGHDLGHTPFGHQGERTLKDILFNKIRIIKNGDLFNPAKGSKNAISGIEGFKEHFGGFKHNYQSVRVASVLEEDFFAFEGLNLSFQTLEGMLKHTRLKDKENDINEFIPKSDILKEALHTDKEFCSTLEGQVVYIADEIAQRGHDLDDALSSGALTLDDFKKYLPIQKLAKLKMRIQPLFDELEKFKSLGRKFRDEDGLTNRRVVSEIYAFLIDDVVSASDKKIRDASVKDFTDDNHAVGEKLIDFSDAIKPINSFLERIIANRVINNSEVALFDNNGAKIVENLFRAYYNDPRLLGREVLRKIKWDISRQGIQNVIDFEVANHEVIRSEFGMIAGIDLNEIDDDRRREYMIKRQILVRSICDYISDMTDTYAISECRRIEK